MTKKINYKDAFAELEDIIDKIENGDADIDILSDKVRRAAELIKICREKLRSTENEITEIIQDLEAEDKE